jgi:hypothetical protein
VVLFVSAFRGKDYAIPPLATFFCACFAKTSVVWIPFIYISTSTQFQLHFVNHGAVDQQIGVNRVDAALLKIPVLPEKNGETAMVPIDVNRNSHPDETY